MLFWEPFLISELLTTSAELQRETEAISIFFSTFLHLHSTVYLKFNTRIEKKTAAVLNSNTEWGSEEIQFSSQDKTNTIEIGNRR